MGALGANAKTGSAICHLPRHRESLKRMTSHTGTEAGRIFVLDTAIAASSMSEYQYYEFQAIDRPLGAADRQALRDLSTRARITATSFTNTYEWGDFKGDPTKLMEQWFDLHLYLANWGSRRLMIRLPARLLDRPLLDGLLKQVDCAGLRTLGEHVILDIVCDEAESDDWDDGSGWLAALTPLRASILAGDRATR
jgi:hypothetical protein